MNYYRRYVGDYLRDTSRLSMLEHGAYNLLLDYYYAEERPISADPTEVYRMVRALMPEERRAIDKVLTTFFYRDGDIYRHKRVEHEIAVSKQARANGKGGGRPKSETGIETGYETEDITEQLTGEEAGTGHPPTTNLQPPAFNLQPPAANKPANAGFSDVLPSNVPYKEIIGLYNRIMEKLPKVRELTGERRAAIRTAWQATKARKNLDFWRCYFEECDADDFLSGEGPYRGEHANWRPDFDYLMRKKVITKVYEKAMHRLEQAA